MTSDRPEPAVVFLSSDLMFGSRLIGAAKALGVPLQIVANAGDLRAKIPASCRLVLVDLSLDKLDLAQTVPVVREVAPAARIVAFGAHVNEAALAGAAAAGCDEVLARGQFHKQYAELLKEAAAMP